MAGSARYLVVGAGFSGAVLARELAERVGASIELIEQRDHLAGNCHTERDAKSGVMVHRYGPHIFNTNREDVWNYVNRFGPLRSFTNRVKASTTRGIFSFPINLHTINQFFGKKLNPEEARQFIETLGDRSIGEPKNFEECALKKIGRDLYETFFYGYTKKQWGCEPSELPASTFQRLPIRFTYQDAYYDTLFQGIPPIGYTELIARTLDHPGIQVRLNTSFDRAAISEFDHVFFTGPIDAFFGFKFGRLGYRTVTFERIDSTGDYQGNPVINYPELAVPFTRIHEHKHFAPWETHDKTVCFREYSQETGTTDIPFYPKRLKADLELLKNYQQLASAQTHTTFLGRLGTYRYLNMDHAIADALDLTDQIVKNPTLIPVFPNSSIQ